MYVFIFILSLNIASFLNVVGLRLPAGQSFVKPRSHCPNCHHTLTPLELIPVFSYLFLRGQCRHCRTKISPLYPLMELTVAMLMTAAPLLVGFTPKLIVLWTLITLFAIIVVSDLAYMIIPNKVLLAYFIIFVGENVWLSYMSWSQAVIGALVGFGLLFLIAVVSKGGMGEGDVKLYFVIGFVLGWKLTLLSFFLATLIGVLYGFILIGTGKLKRKEPMPFAPSIAIGCLISYIVGEELIVGYLQLIL